MTLRLCAVHRCPRAGAPPRCGRGDCPGTRKRRADAARPTAVARGYGVAWQQASAAHLEANPRCVQCGAQATVVDHVVPHRGDPRLFWDRGNWASMCKRDHDRKTATQDTSRDEQGRFARG